MSKEQELSFWAKARISLRLIDQESSSIDVPQKRKSSTMSETIKLYEVVRIRFGTKARIM